MTEALCPANKLESGPDFPQDNQAIEPQKTSFKYRKLRYSGFNHAGDRKESAGGGVVAIFTLAIFMPMWNMMNVVK